jgi:hypothetical protein
MNRNTVSAAKAGIDAAIFPAHTRLMAMKSDNKNNIASQNVPNNATDKKKAWKRRERIALASVIIAAISGVAVWFGVFSNHNHQPEIIAVQPLVITPASPQAQSGQNPPPANLPTPAPAPTPTNSPAPVETAPPPAPSVAPQENLVQEYDDYTFELKECKLEDREDKQVNDGKPHKQLVCNVLVINKTGDRTLNMHGNVNGARTRVIDDMGTEYDFSGGTLGTSPLTCLIYFWPDGANAALVLPSSVPVKAELIFGVTRDGIGYFSPDATSLGVLDIGFISEDIAGRKAFRIQFKNVPIARE